MPQRQGIRAFEIHSVRKAFAPQSIDGTAPRSRPAYHWRHVQNRLVAGPELRAYTRERHAARLKRREPPSW